VCVTGALGFIGTHLCQALAARGARVRCVDRSAGDHAGARRARGLLTGLPNVSVLRADVGRDVLDDALDGARAVIHLAALPGVRAGHDPVELWRENTLTTALLAQETARRGQRLVLVSTSSVYGQASVLPTDERAPPAPLSPYAVSKLAAEQVCLGAVAREGADVVIARLFTVFGERQRPDMAFARWIDGMVAGGPIPWCAGGGTARDFTYVGDAVAGLIAAMQFGRPGQIYNIAGAGSTPLRQALHVLERLLRRSAGVNRAPPFRGEALITSACGKKAARELGYRPAYSLEEGLERQASWALAQYAEPAGGPAEREPLAAAT